MRSGAGRNSGPAFFWKRDAPPTAGLRLPEGGAWVDSRLWRKPGRSGARPATARYFSLPSATTPWSRRISGHPTREVRPPGTRHCCSCCRGCCCSGEHLALSVLLETGRGLLAPLAAAGLAPGFVEVGEVGDLRVEVFVGFHGRKAIWQIALQNFRGSPRLRLGDGWGRSLTPRSMLSVTFYSSNVFRIQKIRIQNSEIRSQDRREVRPPGTRHCRACGRG